MKVDKLVGKTIEMVEYFDGGDFNLHFVDGSCLSVFGDEDMSVILNGEHIDIVDECHLEAEDFALVAEYEERQHAMELEDFDNFGGLRDNTDPVTKATQAEK